MEFVGKSKIGRLSAKGITYPQLRLPHQYSSTIGNVAGVFETEHEGKQAFLVVTERALLKEDTVLKPSEEVLKPVEKTAAESRLSALESEISDLKSALFSNESDAFTKIKNRWARGDSNARPSPCKYGDLRLMVRFSDFIGLSSSRLLEEDTTTRKASAPS